MKMKKLLAAAMAATMIFSSMVTSLVASADSVGTIAAENVTVCPTDAATVDVDVNIPLGAGITAPHIMLEFLLDGYKLTGAKSNVIGENDITVNADAGKIIIETAVKDAQTLTAIDLKVSFAVVGDVAEGAKVLAVNVLDATNVEEEDVVIDGTTATVTVAHAYEASVTAPTCTAEGFTTYTCACGDSYKGDTVAALGHSFAEGTCTVCGEADPNYVPPVTCNHADAETVVTVMPTFDTVGKTTTTCACGYTNTADFYNFTNGIKHNKNSFDATTFQSYYQARIEKTLFQDLEAKGAIIDCYGIMFTTDGSVPAADNDKIQKTIGTYTTPANKGASGSYTGMNLDQMGWTLSFRGYVKFTLNGMEAYYYGPTYSTVYIESLKAAPAEGIINDTIALYDGLASAPALASNTWTGTTISNGTNASITTNKKTFNMTAFQAYYQAKIATAAFNSVAALGTIKNYGIMFTTDGSVPSADNENIQKTATAFVAAGNKGSSGSYTGMNFTQMGWDLSFRAYIEYVDADGNTQYSYGNTEVVKFIDLIASAKDTNAYASELYDFYYTYLVTAE